MATKTRNGNLEDALATLIHNEAKFVSHVDEDRQRFARIERDLDVIKGLLIKHGEMLQKMPDADSSNSGIHPARCDWLRSGMLYTSWNWLTMLYVRVGVSR